MRTTISVTALFVLLVFSACNREPKKERGKASFANQNYVVIAEHDTPESIVEKAAKITPSERQLQWQEFELTAFIHFGVNSKPSVENSSSKNGKEF